MKIDKGTFLSNNAKYYSVRTIKINKRIQILKTAYFKATDMLKLLNYLSSLCVHILEVLLYLSRF
uniref:Uncharacterized protein n=1 Tax=Anguilla anguilla TaxID=7936 RepID=A0A0E9Q788_ANGAN